jgi:chloramphenicol-sensitive protein RarD
MSEFTRALFAGILAFVCWGLFPIYWKLFPELSGDRLFMHRLFWSLLTLAIIIPAVKRTKSFLAIFKDNRRWWLLLSAVLISSNWLLYMIAVTSGHILEASMGYFLNPLLNILFGWLFLKERLRLTQTPAVLLAVLGVIWIGMTAGLDAFPWMALSLSLTWGSYGVIRKLTHVGPLEGLTYETAVVFLPFLLWYSQLGGTVAQDISALGPIKTFGLMLSGVITCLPLVLFAYAARRLPLQTLGFIQYLSPTLKFICGWAIFHEPMPASRWQGFIYIWVGLLWYTIEQLLHNRNQARKVRELPV